MNTKFSRNVSECRSFLDMINYVSQMIPGYFNTVKHLCDPIKRECAFNWEVSQVAFCLLKAKLLLTDVVSYFDPNKNMCTC